MHAVAHQLSRDFGFASSHSTCTTLSSTKRCRYSPGVQGKAFGRVFGRLICKRPESLRVSRALLCAGGCPLHMTPVGISMNNSSGGGNGSRKHGTILDPNHCGPHFWPTPWGMVAGTNLHSRHLHGACARTEPSTNSQVFDRRFFERWLTAASDGLLPTARTEVPKETCSVQVREQCQASFSKQARLTLTKVLDGSPESNCPCAITTEPSEPSVTLTARKQYPGQAWGTLGSKNSATHAASKSRLLAAARKRLSSG